VSTRRFDDSDAVFRIRRKARLPAEFGEIAEHATPARHLAPKRLETTMDTKQEREVEIRHSMFTGAKAFAVGAMLILVLSVTGGPQPPSGDALLFASAAPSVTRTMQSAPPAANPGDATDARIVVPFTETQDDVEALPPQF
jgi:hypothetical protein